MAKNSNIYIGVDISAGKGRGDSYAYLRRESALRAFTQGNGVLLKRGRSWLLLGPGFHPCPYLKRVLPPVIGPSASRLGGCICLSK